MTDSFIGKLLVASSTVTDPIYANGVCLVVYEDDENVVGVMLNRPMKPSSEALLAMIANQPESQSPDPSNRLAKPQLEVDAAKLEAAVDASSAFRALHFGGPLSGPVVAIHQLSQYAEAETGSGIYVAAQKQHLEDLVRGDDGPYRLIVGHLGWEPDQLQSEIDLGTWHVVPATVDTVFSSAKEMWPRVIRRATSSSVAKWIGVEDVAAAGQLN